MEYSRAPAAGWGGIDLFTDGVFPESCTSYLPADRLNTVDTTFALDLPTVIRGKDKKGRLFEMRGVLAGGGTLLVCHDRDEHVRRLCVEVLLFVCIEIGSMVKNSGTVTARAGLSTSEFPLSRIRVRRAAAGTN